MKNMSSSEIKKIANSFLPCQENITSKRELVRVLANIFLDIPQILYNYIHTLMGIDKPDSMQKRAVKIMSSTGIFGGM